MIEALLNIVGPIGKAQLDLATLRKKINLVAHNQLDELDQAKVGETAALLKKHNITSEELDRLSLTAKNASINYKRATYFDFIFPLTVPVSAGVVMLGWYLTGHEFSFDNLWKYTGIMALVVALISMVRKTKCLDKSYRFDQIALYLDDYAKTIEDNVKTLEDREGAMWHMKKPYTRGKFKS